MGQDGKPQMQNAIGPDGNPIQIGTKTVTRQVLRNCPKIIPIDIYDLLIDPDEKIKGHVLMPLEQAGRRMRLAAKNVKQAVKSRLKPQP